MKKEIIIIFTGLVMASLAGCNLPIKGTPQPVIIPTTGVFPREVDESTPVLLTPFVQTATPEGANPTAVPQGENPPVVTATTQPATSTPTSPPPTATQAAPTATQVPPTAVPATASLPCIDQFAQCSAAGVSDTLHVHNDFIAARVNNRTQMAAQIWRHHPIDSACQSDKGAPFEIHA